MGHDHKTEPQADLLLKQGNVELDGFNKIIQILSRPSELKEGLALALAEIEAALGLAYGEVWLFDEFFQQLELIAQSGLPNDVVRTFPAFNRDDGLPNLIVQSQQPLLIADMANDRRVLRSELVTRCQFKSMFGLPLLAQENLMGALIFFSRQVNSFTPEIVSRLISISQLISLTVHNTRLLKTVRQHLVEQSALVAATTAISSSLDLTTVLRSLAQQMVKTLRVTSAYICDWQPRSGASTVLAEYFTPEIPSSERISELGKTYYPLEAFHQIGDWLQNGQMVLIHSDDPALPEQERAYLIQHHALSMLLIPFEVKGTVTGCVQLWESRYRRDFTLAELALCQGIAQQGAIALENARLFEQAQREIVERKRAEEILARQAKEMDQLNRVRTAIARELELPGLVQIVVQAIASAFGYELVSLYLLKDETLVLQYQVGYARVEPQLAKMRKINYQVIRTKKAALVKHPYLDSPYLDISQEINTEICIPLFSRNKIAGTLHIASVGAKVLGETDLRLMETLSEYVNIAFERAYLYTEARESEEKYRTLIEQSRDAIYLIYGNRFEIINHKFEELFGVTKEKINDPSFVFTNIVAPKSRRLIAEQAAVEGGLRYNTTPLVSPVYEFTALDKNGNEIEVELSVSYPTYKGGLATQGILRDITERKRAEAERTALQAQMFQSAKLASVGELAAGIAHEINNPVFAIREYADLILEDIPATDPIHPMLETIIQESNRIADIVRNLLEFARPSETNFNRVHLKEIWRLVFNLIGQSLRQQNILLEVDIPDELPKIEARRQQLQQVLLNLVTNARDALIQKYPDHQPHPQKRIVITARPVERLSSLASKLNESAVQLTVRDEGIGIAPEHRENLFTPFFTTKRHQKGTGLGLSISLKIVEDHHGHIKVESEPGIFTAFIVTLPVTQ